MTTTRHTCAACGRSIGIAYLMCAPHWALVPRELQTAVYRTWGALQRKRLRAPNEQLNDLLIYRRARDAAVNHARERMSPPQGAPDGRPREE